MTHGKQMARVLEAIHAGADTPKEVAEMTGLPRGHCSAWIGTLIKDGHVRHTGRYKWTDHNHKSRCIEPVRQ